VAIDAVSDGIWLIAMAVTGALLLTRRLDTTRDRRPAYAFVVAVMLASNPHVFVHDVVIWTVPVVLCAASLRDAGAEWKGFVRFALLWPLFFAIGGFFDVKSPQLTLIDPRVWALGAAAWFITASWWRGSGTGARESREAVRGAWAGAAAP
jgi:hypothetical protein